MVRTAKARSAVIVGLRLDGKAIGVDPGWTVSVYADRDVVRGWEEIELTRHDDGFWSAHFVAANVELSIQPDGGLETRPAGTYGGYEQLDALTFPDGVSIVYRINRESWSIGRYVGRYLGHPLVVEQR